MLTTLKFPHCLAFPCWKEAVIFLAVVQLRFCNLLKTKPKPIHLQPSWFQQRNLRRSRLSSAWVAIQTRCPADLPFQLGGVPPGSSAVPLLVPLLPWGPWGPQWCPGNILVCLLTKLVWSKASVCGSSFLLPQLSCLPAFWTGSNSPSGPLLWGHLGDFPESLA